MFGGSYDYMICTLGGGDGGWNEYYQCFSSPHFRYQHWDFLRVPFFPYLTNTSFLKFVDAKQIDKIHEIGECEIKMSKALPHQPHDHNTLLMTMEMDTKSRWPLFRVLPQYQSTSAPASASLPIRVGRMRASRFPCCVLSTTRTRTRTMEILKICTLVVVLPCAILRCQCSKVTPPENAGIQMRTMLIFNSNLASYW